MLAAGAEGGAVDQAALLSPHHPHRRQAARRAGGGGSGEVIGEGPAEGEQRLRPRGARVGTPWPRTGVRRKG